MKSTFEKRWGGHRKPTTGHKRMMKAQRREEAAKRTEAWNKLTKDEQVNALLARPGHCAKQLAKIAPLSGVAADASEDLHEAIMQERHEDELRRMMKG